MDPGQGYAVARIAVDLLAGADERAVAHVRARLITLGPYSDTARGDVSP